MDADDKDSHLQQPALSRLNVLNWELALQRKKLQKQSESPALLGGKLQKQSESPCKVGNYKSNQNPPAKKEITKAIKIPLQGARWEIIKAIRI